MNDRFFGSVTKTHNFLIFRLNLCQIIVSDGQILLLVSLRDFPQHVLLVPSPSTVHDQQTIDIHVFRDIYGSSEYEIQNLQK